MFSDYRLFITAIAPVVNLGTNGMIINHRAIVSMINYITFVSIVDVWTMVSIVHMLKYAKTAK